MKIQTIRIIESHPDRPGRMHFVVRFRLKATPQDLANLTAYGARALEALFPDDVNLVKLRSTAGVTKTFDWVEDATAFMNQVDTATDAAHLAWMSAVSFTGEDRD